MSVTSNAEKLKRIIEAKRTKIREEMRKETLKSAKDIRTELYGKTPLAPTFTAITTKDGRRTLPFTHKGGRARASFTNSPWEPGDNIFEVNPYKYEAIVGTKVPYFLFIEEGTRAHGPVTAKFLRFGIPAAGVIFTKWVEGIRPRRIFLTTRIKWAKIWPKRVRAARDRGLK